MNEPSRVSVKTVEIQETVPPKANYFTLILCTMVHVIALGIPVIIIWIAQPGASLFPWHPTCMAVAFGLLMTEAILLFSPQSSVLPNLSRATKATVHWMIQLAAIFFSSAGFAIIFYNKNKHNKKHFTSWHGFFGFWTMVAVLCQAIQGLSIYYPFVALFKATLAQRKQLHALLGTLVFMLASTSLVLGYFSNWFVKNTNDIVWWGSVFSTLSLAGIILGQVSNEYAARKKVAAK